MKISNESFIALTVSGSLHIQHMEGKGAVPRNGPILEDSLRCQEGLCRGDLGKGW